MFRLTSALAMPAAVAAASAEAQTLVIMRGDSRAARPAPADHFTGRVHLERVFDAVDPSHVTGKSVTFEPGARTAWHSHPRGQILVVTAGTGRVQLWGGPIEEIRAGDVVRIPAGQKHWHGASPRASMTHIALSEHRDGTTVEWMEKVSDAESDGSPVRQPQPVMDDQARTAKGQHLTADDTIRDLLNHPAFAGFARLLLPWDDRTYDDDMRLRDVGSLLPYHSQVDPATVVGALNHMIDDVSHGSTVFYDFHSQKDKAAEPAKSHTGLFFFRGKPGAPFAVVSPGGGFSYVGSVHEGFPYAVAISRQGYNAFVLKYRAGVGGTAAPRDLAAALSYIFRNADRLGVSTEAYSLWGSSAGARMAAAVGSHGVARFGGDDLPKPSTVVMAYTGHSEVAAHEPPTFVVVGERDGIAPPAVMERRVAALRRIGTDVVFHRYTGLGHGFGPGTGTSAEGWLDRAIRFWEKFVQSKPQR